VRTWFATYGMLRERSYAWSPLPLCRVEGNGEDDWQGNGALVASLFGLKTLADGVNAHIGANAVITTLAWLAGVAYVCFLLSRPDVTAQFGIDTDELDKPLTRRLACPILVDVGVLLIATSNVDMWK